MDEQSIRVRMATRDYLYVEETLNGAPVFGWQHRQGRPKMV